ncbi:MAG TPA: ABC transporter ATP-binding protein [Bryobacteraceae bacterium]|nr:ABC transporter ATP-binding protein [Bryobacteraceae bacterium]
MIKAAIVKRYPAGQDSAGFYLDVAFEATSGVTILYGPSGSGKTLTLDSIAGFVRPDAGRILLDDRILFDGASGVNLTPQRRSCGYVFQNHALFPNMTLRENLAFAGEGLARLERHRRIAEQLEKFKLTGVAGRYPRELSGGQKQRGSIARALMADPRIVLLDEPATGMDAVLRADLHELIRDLRSSLQVPVIVVTHDPEDTFALADRVLVYDAGKIIHSGTPADLLSNPGTVRVARLLGGFDIFDADVIALDPGRQTSRLRLLGQEMDGPHLRGCFKGDRIAVCIRPEELRLAAKPGDNRIRAELQRTVERAQSVRADFGGELLVDVPRDVWSELAESTRQNGWWIEIPPASLRQLAGDVSKREASK